MIVQPELEVSDTLLATLQAIRAEPYVLHEVFGMRPVDEQQEAVAFFAQRDIAVRLSYPRDAAELPGYYVNIGMSRESVSPIGMLLGSEQISPQTYEEHEAVVFDSTVRVLCVAADNAVIPLWLGEVARWGLLRARGTLGQRGLMEQSLQMSDFEPMPQWFPTLAFRRDLIVSARHLTTVVRTFPALREIQATGVADSGERASYSVHLKG